MVKGFYDACTAMFSSFRLSTQINLSIKQIFMQKQKKLRFSQQIQKSTYHKYVIKNYIKLMHAALPINESCSLSFDKSGNFILGIGTIKRFCIFTSLQFLQGYIEIWFALIVLQSSKKKTCSILICCILQLFSMQSHCFPQGQTMKKLQS